MLIGNRKFYLAIICLVVFLLCVVGMSITSDDFKFTWLHVLATGIGIGAIMGTVIYGYKSEYQFKGIENIIKGEKK